MRTPIRILLAVVCVMHCLLSAQPQEKSSANRLAFVPAGTNGFTFDTGVLRGKLRAEGKSRGLSSVVYVPTGTRLDSSMGLFGHYRVFSANQRYGGGAWDWPSEAKLGLDGSVEIRWPADAERPFELGATYRWAAADILDLETRVQAKTNLVKFESFLASYFVPDFTNSQVWVSELPGKPGTRVFMSAEQRFGTWLTFPRDDVAVGIIRDGRWKFPPSPVDWVIMPRLAAPLGVRRAPATGLTAVVMSLPSDCFAVMTPHQTEGHYSIYLSLFGRDLRSGETARARARLVIGGKLTEEEVVAACERYRRLKP